MLYGPRNSGKTTSLNILIGLLDPSKKDLPQGKDREVLRKDREVLVDYQGVRVAVTTKGDGLEEIEGNLKFAEETGCDILVTAARTRGGTRGGIQDYARKHSISLIEVGAYIAFRSRDLVNLVLADSLNPVLADSLKKVIEELIKKHL